MKPGEALTKSVVVTVKNPIPATPVGVSDRDSFNLRMDNVYGASTVRISIEPPLPKQVEAAATSLPDTGSPIGTAIIIMFCGLSVYFFFRNRQLLTEVKILRADYQGGL